MAMSDPRTVSPGLDAMAAVGMVFAVLGLAGHVVQRLAAGMSPFGVLTPWLVLAGVGLILFGVFFR